MGEIETKLEVVLGRALDAPVRVGSARRLSGGASQETYRIDLEVDGTARSLAMRRAAGGENAEIDPDRPGLDVEALLMRVARQAGVPEPAVVCVLEPGDGLGPGFIMEWLDGETLGARIVKAPELDEVRPRLARECGRILARIHAIDLDATGLRDRLPILDTEDFVRLMWEDYKAFETPQPMIDYTARWLLDHLPEPGQGKLVHNDFRNGNIMIGPDGVRAVLDWELAHVGDPMRDLGWICTNSWRFGRTELPVGGFGHREDLLAGYEQESGIAVDPAHLHFWEVFGSFWWAIGCLRMAYFWRHGPDPSVERPGIARRSSECQVDCANLLIPGPVELVDPGPVPSSSDMPDIEELLSSVRDFLRKDVRAEVQGRNNFLSLVASNSLDIALRELRLTPGHQAQEQERLVALLGHEGALTDLRWELTRGLRDGAIALEHPGLAEHLRATTVNQLAIDQPKYSGLANALAANQEGDAP